MTSHIRSRRGATAVEFAFVAPVLLSLLLGTVVGGLGIVRYQQVANLARECSRWASVHGGQYQQETDNAAATPDDVYNNVIAVKNMALDLSHLSYAVTWNTDNYPYHTTIVNDQLVPVTNTVQVVISYQWVPETIFPAVTLSSTSITPMAY